MTAFDRLLPFGLTAELLFMILAGTAAFASVMAVWYGLLERDPMEARIKSLRARRDELRNDLSASNRKTRSRRQESIGLMSRIVMAMKLLQHSQSRKLSDRLAQAGWRSRDALIVYLFCRVAAPLAFGIAAFFLVFGLGVGELPQPARMGAVIGGVLFGYAVPLLYVSNVATKRQQAIQKGLPDALDLLVICAEAGLSLDASIDRVSREVGGSCPELADELSLTGIELGFLPERRTALANLARRVDLPSVRGVVNTLIQTEKYGTPLSQSLRVLSSEFRDQRMMRAEEKAARLPATMTVPMILFILPALFIVLIGPAMISVYDNLIAG